MIVPHSDPGLVRSVKAAMFTQNCHEVDSMCLYYLVIYEDRPIIKSVLVEKNLGFSISGSRSRLQGAAKCC